MVGNVLSILVWLVIPAVLWAIPRTRRMTGNWIVALKSVPVGCAAVTVVMALALGCVFRRVFCDPICDCAPLRGTFCRRLAQL